MGNVRVAYVHGWQMSMGGGYQGDKCLGGISLGVAKIKVANVVGSQILGDRSLGG